MTLTDLVFSSVNAPLTYLLIGLGVYRVTTMLFGMDLDFDLDFDVDVDADMETEIETSTSVDVSGLEIDDLANMEIKNKAIVNNRNRDLKWWQVFLIYFNFSELPFLFTFSTWIFFWWIITLIGTYYTYSYDNNFGAIIFFIAIIPSLIINKIFTNPFKAFFKKLNRKGVEKLDLLGRTGTLISSNISNDKMGSVKLFVENDPINIYVKSLDGEIILSGKEVLIIKQSTDKKFYYVKTYN